MSEEHSWRGRITELRTEALGPYDDPGPVWAHLAELGDDATGWACLDHTITSWPTGARTRLEAAEVCAGNTSIHVRRAGTKWNVYRYTEGEGGEAMRMRVSELLSTKPGDTRELVYRVYWAPRPTSGAMAAPAVDVFQPVCARFVGWKETD